MYAKYFYSSKAVSFGYNLETLKECVIPSCLLSYTVKKKTSPIHRKMQNFWGSFIWPHLCYSFHNCIKSILVNQSKGNWLFLILVSLNERLIVPLLSNYCMNCWCWGRCEELCRSGKVKKRLLVINRYQAERCLPTLSLFHYLYIYLFIYLFIYSFVRLRRRYKPPGTDTFWIASLNYTVQHLLIVRSRAMLIIFPSPQVTHLSDFALSE